MKKNYTKTGFELIDQKGKRVFCSVVNIERVLNILKKNRERIDKNILRLENDLLEIDKLNKK